MLSGVNSGSAQGSRRETALLCGKTSSMSFLINNVCSNDLICDSLIIAKEVFPSQYGPEYDRDLKSLFWEFLCRLVQLLPVPDLKEVRNIFMMLSIVTAKQIILNCH